VGAANRRVTVIEAAQSPDIVVIGGGIAGAGLAVVLAERNIEVAVLERDLAPIDRVRGEYAPPWGVAELRRIGLLDCLLQAGGAFAVRNIPYDEDSPGEAALPLARDLSNVLPDVPGSFCMSHRATCSALAAEATRRGAYFVRGVEDIELVPGAPPTVRFRRDGRECMWRPRLVIGADGRGRKNCRRKRSSAAPLTLSWRRDRGLAVYPPIYEIRLDRPRVAPTPARMTSRMPMHCCRSSDSPRTM
jgi:2-polyprenyl-6-methoxyphenol hydroxylase-like FAD-dependent oxidoreductase